MDPISNIPVSSEPVKHRQLPLLAAILSLLVLSIIAALAYQNFILRKQLSSSISVPFVSPDPSPNPTAGQIPNNDLSDWKTYRNINLGISIQHPNSWFLNIESPNTKFEDVRLQNYDPKTAPSRGYDPEEDKGMFAINISRWDLKNGSKSNTITELLKEINGDLQCFFYGDPAGTRISLDEEQYRLNNYSVYSRKTGCSNMDKSLYQTEIYVIDGQGKTAVLKPSLDIVSEQAAFDQILSTFRFTDSSCTSCPQIAPPAPNFCANGTIIPGQVDACGCQLPPTCKTN